MGIHRLTVPLDDGEVAHITLPIPISQADSDRIGSAVACMVVEESDE